MSSHVIGREDFSDATCNVLRESLKPYLSWPRVGLEHCEGVSITQRVEYVHLFSWPSVLKGD